jgi:molybdopterin-guanine dinucleotide biosynthesis protein A
MSFLAGIFVGGASARMGAPKGLLTLPSGETLISRWQRLFSELGVPSVLVGRRPEYASLGIETLDDAETGIGPLGGLIALLRTAAAERDLAVSVACDMPRVSPALLRRLLDAPDGPAVAPRLRGHWESLFSRFDPARVLPVAERHAEDGVFSLQRLLDAVSACPLDLAPEEEALLVDWDFPADPIAP